MNWILVVNTFAVLYYLSLHFVSGLVTATLMFSAHILGWIAQFIGHGVFEGRKPALMDNLLQVFSAPLFVMLGYAPELEKQCEAAVLKKLPKTDYNANKKSS